MEGIELQLMKRGQEKRLFLLLKSFYETCGDVCVPFDVVYNIISLPVVCVNKPGLSSYARKRRALKLGKCFRCYRVLPSLGGLSTKCDSVTCRPGISGNSKAINFIKWGVSRAEA